MADLASQRIKINDIEISNDAPITAATNVKIGGAINDYLDKDWRELIITANTSWTSVSEFVHVTIVGGGGGGGSGASVGILGTAAGAGSGGSGGQIFDGWVTTVIGNNYAAVVGAGGAGGAGVGNSQNGNSGSNGSNSTMFGITAEGGLGGNPGLYTPGLTAGASVGGTYSGRGYKCYGGAGNTAAQYGQAGESSNRASGGAGSGTGTANFSGGGGGGASYGAGGAGDVSALANTGGGGGGSMGTDSGATGNAGNGGSGVIILRWYGNA